jgi:exopolyphosphatase/pppGpp-phosphohydrolase
MLINGSEYEAAALALPCDHVVFTDLDGREGVLVDLNTRKYYQLNETASVIWQGLEKRFPVSQIAKEMTERYDVTLERATSSIETALRHFDAEKLLAPRNPR